MENYILIILASLVFSAFFSGMEIAFYQVNKLQVELNKNKGVTTARLLSYFIRKPSKFITNTLVGNNMALVIYGFAFTSLFGKHFDYFGITNYYLSFIIITLTSSIFVLVFAEFLPKATFIINPNLMLNFFIIPFMLIFYLLFPINIIISFISKLILNISGAKIEDKKPVFDYYDLFSYVEEDVGLQNRDSEVELDTQILKNVIELPNIKIRECMIPRLEVNAVRINDSCENLKRMFIETGHSKIPVYKDNIDEVIGYVHVIDIYKQPSTIEEIIKTINIIPESMPANRLLKTFIDTNRSLGLVVDEFGGTAGIVTIEDLLEEIFGEIKDEYDIEELREVKVNDNEFIFSARLEIDYLNDKYHLNLPEGDYETLGGFILEIYESIPVRNEIIKFKQFEFKVISASENRIEEVSLKVMDASQENEE